MGTRRLRHDPKWTGEGRGGSHPGDIWTVKGWGLSAFVHPNAQDVGWTFDVEVKVIKVKESSESGLTTRCGKSRITSVELTCF